MGTDWIEDHSGVAARGQERYAGWRVTPECVGAPAAMLSITVRGVLGALIRLAQLSRIGHIDLPS